MWVTMIEKVKLAIYKHERNRIKEFLSFYDAVHQILIDRDRIKKTSHHCLAHSLNPRYSS